MRIRTIAILATGIGIGAASMHGLHAQAKPPVFLVFDAEVKDRNAYMPFLQSAVKEVQAQGGKFIVQGAKPDMLSGSETPNIISVSQWASKEDVLRWFNSEPMKPVREAQAKYTATRLFILEGRRQ